MHLPIEIYQLLEDRLGREDAKKVAEAIELGLSHIETRSREMATQRKLEIKDELKQELRDELATKEDVANLRTEIANLRSELKEEIASVRSELKEEIASVRSELKEEIASVRSELKEDIASIRSELKEDIASVRSELKEEITGTRSELKEDTASLRTELVRLESRLDRKFTVLWLITIFVIVLLNQNALEFLGRMMGLLK